jgi:hypothetical protein
MELFTLFILYIYWNTDLSLAESEVKAQVVCEGAFYTVTMSERAEPVCAEAWDRAGFIY